jgi:hypothetical protein
MAFKVNYNHARAERDRAKREKKAEKLKAQQERTAQRKAERDNTISNETDEQNR